MQYHELHNAIKLISSETKDSPKLSIHAVLVLLECMKYEEGITGIDLAEFLDMPKATLWRAMAYWTEYTEGGKSRGKAWLTRDIDSIDGRAVIIHMTPKGRKIRDKLLSGKG
jgi:DNA-binding MarR family transcriptional regulator